MEQAICNRRPLDMSAGCQKKVSFSLLFFLMIDRPRANDNWKINTPQTDATKSLLAEWEGNPCKIWSLTSNCKYWQNASKIRLIANKIKTREKRQFIVLIWTSR